MLSILSLILGKMVDIVLKRADLRRDAAGPLKLFDLYLSLREIIVTAKIIEKKLEETVQNPNHPISLEYRIKRQMESIERFCNVLWELIFYIEIFERDVYEELAEIAGWKFMTLRSYYKAICKMHGGELILRELTAPDSLKQLMFYAGIDVDDGESASLVRSRRYDLTNVGHLILLRDQAQANIASLELTLHKLGDFIKSNCELKDLFPATIIPRR